MSRRKNNLDNSKSIYPPELVLAEKWAKKMGKKVKRLESKLPDGNNIPILSISHGKMAVLVRHEFDIIAVFVFAELPDDIQNRFKKINIEKQELLIESLKHQLLSNGRTGYYLEPLSASIISELKGFTIEQRLRISNKDPGSFNRLMDSIQEVMTVTIRALMIFGILPPEHSSTEISGLKPPDEMYV